MKLPDGQSLIQKAFLRAVKLAPTSEILTVTNRDYFFISQDELEALGTGHGHLFLLEPEGRNTAPAIALAALCVRAAHGENAILTVMPADHLVSDEPAFQEAVHYAAAVAATGRLVTLGAKPERPDSGFGYIEYGKALDHGGARAVERFIEKPSVEKAEEFIRSGSYLWNCGIFIFSAGTMLRELQSCAPDVLRGAEACWSASERSRSAGSSMVQLDSATFGAIPEISVDYAVFEKSEMVAVVPCAFGWSDIGSWTAISELVGPDKDGNRIIGDAIAVDSKNTFMQSEDRLVAAVGVDDLLIVDTSDAVLVAQRSRAQDVRKVVERLKAREHESYKTHRTVARPWGTYTVLEEGPRFKIKRIVVKPKGRLSLQMHHHRSEHWVVVSGVAKVTNGESEFDLKANQSTYIPAGCKHRLENPGDVDLVLIEVQSGEYLGEDDIVRFEDHYGRA
jgi:mannose-1-phosphate guanylyltransferase